jgi:hypothetical protein
MSEMLVFLVLSCAPNGIDQTDPPNFDVLKAVSGIYDENKAKFLNCAITFEFVDAYAVSFEEAARGVLTDVQRTDGKFAIRGQQIAYECVFSDDSMRAAAVQVADGRTATRLNSFRAVTNGKLTITDRILVGSEGKLQRGTHIDSERGEFFTLVQIPLSLGVPDNYREDLSRVFGMIVERAAGMQLKRIDEGVEISGVKTIRVELSTARGKRVVWVDPERGGIPLLTHDEMSDGTSYRLQYGDVRLVPDHGWLPFDTITYLPGGRVKRLRVKTLDFGKLADETFRLAFPAPVAMINLASNVSYRPQKAWDLSSLPSATSENVTPLATVPATDPEFPTSRGTGLPYFQIAILVISIIGIAGFLWWRKR